MCFSRTKCLAELFAALMLAICLAAPCGAAWAGEPDVGLVPSTTMASGQAAVPTPPLADLLQYAVDQDGTPYRKGGISPEHGFDCSGFVRYVFEHVEGVALPHSARALSLLGEKIGKADLQPGDLVFFRIMRHTISHVGIYLGDNRFIHASSRRSGGVRISDLADSYWAKRFTLARRLAVTPAQQALGE